MDMSIRANKRAFEIPKDYEVRPAVQRRLDPQPVYHVVPLGNSLLSILSSSPEHVNLTHALCPLHRPIT